MTTGGQSYYYHHDAVGSITDLTDSAGAAVLSYDLEPFGALRGQATLAPNAPANPIRYTGQYYDAETAQYYMRARVYDPGTSRFTQTDPEPSGRDDPAVGAYVYVNNRPTVISDPSGRKWCLLICLEDLNPFKNMYENHVSAQDRAELDAASGGAVSQTINLYQTGFGAAFDLAASRLNIFSIPTFSDFTSPSSRESGVRMLLGYGASIADVLGISWARDAKLLLNVWGQVRFAQELNRYGDQLRSTASSGAGRIRTTGSGEVLGMSARGEGAVANSRGALTAIYNTAVLGGHSK